MNFETISQFAFILAADEPPPSVGFGQFLPIILMVVMMYFLLIRPQRMRQKALQAQVDAMKKGDAVISAGGIHGVVTNLKDGTVTVKVAENVKLLFQKNSITTVIPKGSAKDDADLSNQPETGGEPLKG